MSESEKSSESTEEKRKPGRPSTITKNLTSTLPAGKAEPPQEVKYVIIMGKAGWRLSKFFSFWAATVIAFAAGFVVGILYGVAAILPVVIVYGVTSFLEWIYFYVSTSRATVPRKVLLKELD